MVKHIQDPKTGRMAGSIGVGKSKTPHPNRIIQPSKPATSSRPTVKNSHTIYELIELSVDPKMKITYPIIRKYMIRYQKGVNSTVKLLDETSLQYNKYWDGYHGTVEFTIQAYNQEQLIELGALDAQIDIYQTKIYALDARQQYKEKTRSNKIRKFFRMKQIPVTEIKTDAEIENYITSKYKAVEKRTGIKIISD